jgi:D-serine dehydratase
MKNKLKKGLIIGSLLAVGAAIGFATTKDMKQIAKDLKKNLNKLQDVTKVEFDELVTKAVEKHAKKMDLTSDARQALMTALRASWREIEKECHSGKK